MQSPRHASPLSPRARSRPLCCTRTLPIRTLHARSADCISTPNEWRSGRPNRIGSNQSWTVRTLSSACWASTQRVSFPETQSPIPAAAFDSRYAAFASAAYPIPDDALELQRLRLGYEELLCRLHVRDSLESLCTMPTSCLADSSTSTNLQSWFDELFALSVGCASIASAAAVPLADGPLSIDLREADRCTNVRYVVDPSDRLRALLAWTTTTQKGRVIRFTVGEKAQDGAILAHADLPISRLQLRAQSYLKAGKTAVEFIVDAVGSLDVCSDPA